MVPSTQLLWAAVAVLAALRLVVAVARPSNWRAMTSLQPVVVVALVRLALGVVAVALLVLLALLLRVRTQFLAAAPHSLAAAQLGPTQWLVSSTKGVWVKALHTLAWEAMVVAVRAMMLEALVAVAAAVVAFTVI